MTTHLDNGCLRLNHLCLLPGNVDHEHLYLTHSLDQLGLQRTQLGLHAYHLRNQAGRE